ncbi:MAG TPA: MazG family protein [Candidatus Limnocylindria bacterium]|nr:MazG family protein [Candidatus Limnocylindria bacterium]
MFPEGVDVVRASTLDRFTFATSRAVAVLRDADVDRAFLVTRYPAAVVDAALAAEGRWVILPAQDALADLATVGAIARIADRLRAPDGCPWDREQTHETLRPLLLEEAYETLDALGTGDSAALREELGDLLFHVVIHAQLAREAGAFDLGDVARSIGAKLVRRHPHVFADAPLAGDLYAQWERIKKEERAEKGAEGSVLAGMPRDLPALYAAERLLERAARIGIAPERTDLPLDVDDAEQVGELLFDLAALAREIGVDAETALRDANARFGVRVRAVEARAREAGRDLASYAPAELRTLWEATA